MENKLNRFLISGLALAVICMSGCTTSSKGPHIGEFGEIILFEMELKPKQETPKSYDPLIDSIKIPDIYQPPVFYR